MRRALINECKIRTAPIEHGQNACSLACNVPKDQRHCCAFALACSLLCLRFVRATGGGPMSKTHMQNRNAVDAKTLLRTGLIYVNDGSPGLQRRRAGKGFVYVLPSGKRLRNDAAIARIRSLAIPPAYTQVWICPSANGHIQATGRDARGRKQYRYHSRWREQRDTAKYDRLAAFAKKLPLLRRQINQDLRLHGLPRRKVVAAVVSLLERSFIRVGNEEYSRSNGSYGLTTLRNRHVRVRGESVAFEFRGKSGKFHSLVLADARLAVIVKRCQELPGQQLFQFINDEGKREGIDSDDVNSYIRSAVGEEFSAKDFRTWAGTLLAAQALSTADEAESVAERKQQVADVIGQVSKRLGNTPSVCRKCYVHPAVLDAYLDGKLDFPALGGRSTIRLNALERALLRLLKAARARS
jgi:DNA topoisomerase I